MHGRGLPSHVLQKEVKSRASQDAMRGAVKVALLKNDPEEVPNVIACSIYDTKPVHFSTTVAPKVDWIVKERKVWSEAKLSNVHIKSFRLNLVDDYNKGMGHVDVADQLCLQYRPDRWMCPRKWWWTFFIWGIGIATMNAYALYHKIHEREEENNRQNHPRKLTHIEFLSQIANIFGQTSTSRPSRDSEATIHGHEHKISRQAAPSMPGSRIRMAPECGNQAAIALASTHTTTMSDTNLTGGFPPRHFDNKFHAFYDAEARKLCQLCARKEREHDPVMGMRTGENVMTNTGRQKTVVKRTSRNTNNIMRTLCTFLYRINAHISKMNPWTIKPL
eukprot:scaffold57390_cov45-Attheya_sp.AAC.1